MRCRPWLLRVLVVLPVLGAGGYLAVGVWQDWLGPWVRGYYERQHARAEEARRWKRHRADSGIVGELANGRVRAGDSLAAVTARFPPSFVHPFQRFTRVGFDYASPPGSESWVEVTVLDGRLVAATWCERDLRWPLRDRIRFANDTFFDVTTPADQALYRAETLAYARGRQEVFMAVASPAGYTALQGPPIPPDGQ